MSTPKQAWESRPAHKAEVRGVEVVELDERASRKAMRTEFCVDDGFQDSQPDDSNWAVLAKELDEKGWTERGQLRAEVTR